MRRPSWASSSLLSPETMKTARRAGISRLIVCSLSAQALLSSACGALQAPVIASAQDDGRPDARPMQDQGSLTLTVIEGRPSGLLLRAQAHEASLRDASQLVVWRRRGDEQAATALHTLSVLPEQRRELASSRGVSIFDPSVESGQRYAYQVQLLQPQGERVASSAWLTLDWAPPRAPEQARAQLLQHQDGPRVLLSWTPKPGLGALILRRDLLAQEGFERVAWLGSEHDHVYLDRGVRPAGVYAYRVAYARRALEAPLLGMPSPELFVSVPPSSQEEAQAAPPPAPSSPEPPR